jgi:hypothetical protein
MFCYIYEKAEDRELTEDILFLRIDACFDDFRPDIFIIHAGYAYMDNKSLVTRVIARLKCKYTSVQFGARARWGCDPKELLEAECPGKPILSDDTQVTMLLGIIG